MLPGLRKFASVAMRAAVLVGVVAAIIFSIVRMACHDDHISPKQLNAPQAIKVTTGIRICNGTAHFRAYTVAASDIEKGTTLTLKHLAPASAQTNLCPCELCVQDYSKHGEICETPIDAIETSPSELVGFKTTARIRKGSVFTIKNLDLSQSTGFIDACICEKFRLSKLPGETGTGLRAEIESLGLK